MTWNTVAVKRNVAQGKDVQVVRFKPVRTRYVRVVGTRLRPDPDGGKYSLQIVELEVFE